MRLRPRNDAWRRETKKRWLRVQRRKGDGRTCAAALRRTLLTLMSRTERPVFIMFATETPAEATVRIGGRNRQLGRKTTSGERVLGHFERQTFANEQYSLEVELTYDTTRPIQDGAIIKQGVMRTVDKKGFATVVPIGGMIGCQKKA